MVICASCIEYRAQDDAVTPVMELAGNDSIALFRGHRMGDLPEDVRQSETWIPKLDTDTLMQFDHLLEKDSIVVAAYYSFDDFGLFEMQFDLFPKDSVTVVELQSGFNAYLTRRFGHSEGMGGALLWTTVSPANERVEIVLSNESADYGKPFLSLNFLELLDDEF